MFQCARAHWQQLLAGCSKVQSLADSDRTLMFQCVRAHWQLNSCLLAAVRCKALCLDSYGYVYRRGHRKANKRGGEKTTFVQGYRKRWTGFETAIT